MLKRKITKELLKIFLILRVGITAFAIDISRDLIKVRYYLIAFLRNGNPATVHNFSGRYFYIYDPMGAFFMTRNLEKEMLFYFALCVRLR